MTKRINDEIIEKINEDTSIVDIISDYVQLKRTGTNHVGLCPFHNEKTPSFTVSESKKFFHCFGCGESGNAITFIMKRENLDFREAVVFLADKIGVEIEEGSEEDQRYVDERLKTYEINRKAAKYFYNNLKESRKAQQYLVYRRLSGKVINQFGLGYSQDSWEHLYNYLKKDYSDEDILRTGLIGRKKENGYYDKLRNRIIFPIIDTKSRVIGFGGRLLDDGHPKYLNSPDTNVFNKGNHLYGLNLLSKYSNRKRILLVEGYMDVISLFNMGINYSVASLGTALSERQAKLLKRYGDDVFICYDSDDAGIKATFRAIDIMMKEDMSPRIIVLPRGMDPDDFIKKYGLLEFEKLFLDSKNGIEFKVQTIKDKYDLENLEDKITFTREVASLIRGLKSPIEQDGYIDQISSQTGISKEAIEQEVRITKKSYNYTKDDKNKTLKKNIGPIQSKLPLAGIKAEIDLTRLIIKDKDYFEYISEKLEMEEFQSPECKYIYNILRLSYEDLEIIDKKVLLTQILEIPNLDRVLIDNIFLNDIEYQATNINQVIDDLVNSVKYSNLKNQERDLLIKIEKLDYKDRNKEENELLKKLMWDLMELKKELNPNN